jgi:hypothetical protein
MTSVSPDIAIGAAPAAGTALTVPAEFAIKRGNR